MDYGSLAVVFVGAGWCSLALIACGLLMLSSRSNTGLSSAQLLQGWRSLGTTSSGDNKVEEKDLKSQLPEEPSWKDLARKKHEEEFGKLKPGLRELADLAEDLTEYHRFDKEEDVPT